MANFWPKFRLGLSLILIVFLAVSCSNKRRGGVVLVSNCPAVGLVEHLNALTRFASNEQTNKDVVLDAVITDLNVECSQGTSVRSDISFSIRAKKGPASNSQAYTLSYHVVVIRDNYLITNKKTYTTQVRFPPGSDTTSVREHLVHTFGTFEDPRRYDYEVLIGFEVTPEELEFNVVRQQIPN